MDGHYKIILFFSVTKSSDDKESAKMADEAKGEAIPTLPRVEVVRRLRERLEPILMFGESHAQACERLRQIEIDAPESFSGITNDFQ